MTEKRRRSDEFRKNCDVERDASFCFCTMQRSSKICEFLLETGWRLSGAIGKVFIPFVLMTGGELYFGGETGMLLMCM